MVYREEEIFDEKILDSYNICWSGINCNEDCELTNNSVLKAGD